MVALAKERDIQRQEEATERRALIEEGKIP